MHTEHSTKGSEILLSILWTYCVCAFYTVLKKNLEKFKSTAAQIHKSDPTEPMFLLSILLPSPATILRKTS